jgi:transcriptional regulator with XRE-family HTH domain
LGYPLRSEYYRGVSKTKATQVGDVFREFLRELRLAKNMTQTQVAERLGLPQSYVSKYETGERRLDFVETVFVCEALETSVEEFATAFARRLAKVRRAKAS